MVSLQKLLCERFVFSGSFKVGRRTDGGDFFFSFNEKTNMTQTEKLEMSADTVVMVSSVYTSSHLYLSPMQTHAG